MLTVAYLNHNGYETMQQLGKNATSSAVISDLNSAMYDTVAYTPLTIGILQTIIWSFYTIRNSHNAHKRLVWNIYFQYWKDNFEETY